MVMWRRKGAESGRTKEAVMRAKSGLCGPQMIDTEAM
jgi:hypothetical protein